MTTAKQREISNKLVELAKLLQPTVSSDGRTLKISSNGRTIAEIKQLRSSVVQEQRARFR